MAVDIVRVLKARPRKHEHVQLAALQTPWTRASEPRGAHAAGPDRTAAGPGRAAGPGAMASWHPRPQAARADVTVLDGLWDYAFADCACAEQASRAWRTAEPPEAWDGRILVPFSPEAPASGVGRTLQPHQLLWYGTELPAPQVPEGGKLLLHFDGVDWACALWADGAQVGVHTGGILPFAFDLTQAAAAHAPGQALQLRLCVLDPTEAGVQLRGKQRLDRGDIWYTAQSGIWGTVWTEVLPARRIERFHLAPHLHDGTLDVEAQVTGSGGLLSVAVLDAQGRLVAQANQSGDADGTRRLSLQVPSPRAWSPEDPCLYQVDLRFGEDTVHSYTAFRTCEVREDGQGTPRFFLNGRPYFVRGVLDQGRWPDGLLTPPGDGALAFDVELARSLGFNMMRKHLKVEAARWYWHCDRLGMLVWQDMATGGGAYDTWTTSHKPTLWRPFWSRFDDRTGAHQRRTGGDDPAYQREWTETALATVEALRDHPCVACWTLFNEGWGQFDARSATRAVRAADPTRPIDATSGWFDQGCGDFFSVHNYFRALEAWPAPERGSRRAFFISEFGGASWLVSGHSSLPVSYGYERADSQEAWAAGVREVLAAADALEQAGCAGFCYTQLSDVEEEANGLVTYDRQVVKLPQGD